MQKAQGQEQRVHPLLLDKAFSLGVDLQQLQEQTLIIDGRLQAGI